MAINVSEIEESTQQGKTIGVITSDGKLRLRKEIDEFVKDADCFNLYLLALIDLQRLPRWDDAFSYFQIAGIHGKPFSPWDGVTQEKVHTQAQRAKHVPDSGKPPEPNLQAGYCSHSSNLFPTWHRAYLAMFEQTVFLQMVSVATAFPLSHRKKYLDASERFGLPYWDPLLPRRKVTNKYGYSIIKCGIPVIMSTKDVRVRTPHQPDQLSDAPYNPLYAYHFAPESSNWSKEAGFSFMNMFADVVKNPSMTLNTIRGLSPAGTTNHQYVNNTLTNAVSAATGPALPLGSKIYRILQGPPLSYTQMSNSAYVSRSPSESPMNRENSLEGFHNDIHTMCGNGGNGRTGHMGLTEFAAFDPMFWLHHTNVDRIFAIWQTLNPETWNWRQDLLDSPTFVTAIGEAETPDSPLVPFRREVYKDTRSSADVDIWWTSTDLRDCAHLGYTYPELRLSKGEGEKTDLKPLRQWVTDTYEWSTIYGDSPPWRSLFESEDFSRVEALPKMTRIDGKGEPVEIQRTSDVKPRLPARVRSWFHRGGQEKNVGFVGHGDRYKHIRPLMKGTTLTHWNITVKVQKFALNGSFQIFFFLGDFDDNSDTWSHERHLVGIDGIFANRHVEHCENCRHQVARGLLDSDTIALTTNLVAYWKNEEVHGGMRLHSLEPKDVLPFLKHNLHWRVLDSYGRQHDPQNIESLHVDIGSQTVNLPVEYGALPVYEEEVIHSLRIS